MPLLGLNLENPHSLEAHLRRLGGSRRPEQFGRRRLFDRLLSNQTDGPDGKRRVIPLFSPSWLAQGKCLVSVSSSELQHDDDDKLPIEFLS